MAKGDMMLIDVRGPEEIIMTGKVHFGNIHAVNIPLPDILGGALSLNPKLFKKKYHVDQPVKNSHIVFSCRSGVGGGVLFYFVTII